MGRRDHAYEVCRKSGESNEYRGRDGSVFLAEQVVVVNADDCGAADVCRVGHLRPKFSYRTIYLYAVLTVLTSIPLPFCVRSLAARTDPPPVS